MADENTQVEAPLEETQNEDSYEKRYKDLQSHKTKLEQENKALKEATEKDKELFDTLQPYVNWDAINGTPQPTEDDDGLVDKKTLNQTIKEVQDQIQRDRVTQNFRIRYPDMIAYEDLVAVYLGKTDARRPMEERIAKAVQSTKALLEAERGKGKELYEKETKEKTAKEAEASGLGAGKGPKGTEEEPKGETFEEYLAGRQNRSAKSQGLI